MAKPATPIRDLERDMKAAAALKSQIKDILGDGLDALTLRDTIEGETDLFATIDAVLAQIGEDEARIDGLTKFMSTLAARKKRLEDRGDIMRAMLMNALDMLEEKRLERPAATVTLKLTSPKLSITDESLVPSKYWKSQDPVLAKKELTDALKARRDAYDAFTADVEAGQIAPDELETASEKLAVEYPLIPGAELDNGSATVQIRFA